MLRFSFVLIHRGVGIGTSCLAEGLNHVLLPAGTRSPSRAGAPRAQGHSIQPQARDQPTLNTKCHMVFLEQAVLLKLVNSRNYGRKHHYIYKENMKQIKNSAAYMSRKGKRDASHNHSMLTWALTQNSCMMSPKRNLMTFKHFFF